MKTHPHQSLIPEILGAPDQYPVLDPANLQKGDCAVIGFWDDRNVVYFYRPQTSDQDFLAAHDIIGVKIAKFQGTAISHRGIASIHFSVEQARLQYRHENGRDMDGVCSSFYVLE